MRKVDQWNGLIFLVFSGLICWGSALLPYGDIRHPGPGFLPLWCGIILGVLSIGLLVKNTVRRGVQSKLVWELFSEKVRWGKVLSALLALLSYTFLMDYLGFLIMTILFLTFLLRFIDPQPWKTVVGWALGGSIASYLIFEIWMKLNLPKGFLGL